MWSDWSVSCDFGFYSVCPLMEKGKGLMEASWWERLRVKLGLVLMGPCSVDLESNFLSMGGATLSKSLIQFSVDGRSCVPSLLFDLRPNYGGGNEDNGDLLQKVPCTHCCTQCFWPWSRPQLTHASAGDSWTLMGMSGSVSWEAEAPFSWVLVCTRFCLCPPRVGSLQGWTFSFHASHIIRPAGCMGFFLDIFFIDPSIFESHTIRLYHLLLELSSVFCFPFIRDISLPSLKILAPKLFSTSSY